MNKYLLILLFSSLSFSQNQNDRISFKVKQLNASNFDNSKVILLLKVSNYKVCTDYNNLTNFISDCKDKNVLIGKDFLKLKEINHQSNFPIDISDFFISDKERINYIIAELLLGGNCLIEQANNEIIKEVEVKEIITESTEKREFWIEKLKIMTIVTKVF
jgi:hypothetical protein